jgi:hypothetical protein
MSERVCISMTGKMDIKLKGLDDSSEFGNNYLIADWRAEVIWWVFKGSGGGGGGEKDVRLGGWQLCRYLLEVDLNDSSLLELTELRVYLNYIS